VVAGLQRRVRSKGSDKKGKGRAPNPGFISQRGKIAAATFRELLVRMEVNKKRKDIINELQRTDNIDKQMEAATAIICM
jgi:hypothetical protein